ncbi:MAG: HAD-IA family hydrolase [Polyangia bacterium]
MSIVVETSGLLFDMDGVLVSSIASVNRSWRTWAVRHGVPGGATIEVPHGTRALDIVRAWAPRLDPAVGLREIEEIEEIDLEGLEALPGARELLHVLPPDRWAIVTSATRRLLEVRLAAAGLPVPAHVVTAEMVTHGKPHAEPYQRGAALLGLAPSACIVAEDAPSGVAAGVAAGARVLGVLGEQDPAALEQEGVTWMVPSLARVTVVRIGTTISLALP